MSFILKRLKERKDHELSLKAYGEVINNPIKFINSIHYRRLIRFMNLYPDDEYAYKIVPLKETICEVLYIRYLTRRLNSKKFNNILFNCNYIGGHYAKQKIEKNFIH